MSMLLMVRVMELELGSPLKKLVMLKLADNANDQGECWPSYGHIAKHCEMGKSTVRKHIKELEKMGYLRLENRKGPKGNSSNLYHVIADPMPPRSTGCSTSEHTPMPPRSTRTSQLESVKEPVTETDEKPAVVEWPDYVTSEMKSDIAQLRKNAKAPLTNGAKKGIIKQFNLAIEKGYTIEQCMEQWNMAGWRSFQHDWLKIPPANQSAKVLTMVELAKIEQTEEQKNNNIQKIKGLRA